MHSNTQISIQEKDKNTEYFDIKTDEFGPAKILEVYDPAIGMRGFLVIDNITLGPGKGGMRMSPSVTREEVFRLARVMTWKNALAGIDFGGAKSGIVWEGGSDEMKKKYVESFARAIKAFIPKQYISAPDVGTGEKEMQWFVEAIHEFKGATGKPATYCKGIYRAKKCGIPHEVGSTGYGVAQATKAAMEFSDQDIRGAKVAIHGFGNVGSFAFKFLKEMGANVVAVADRDVALFASEGLPGELFDLGSKRISLKEYKGGGVQEMNPEEILLLDVDVLIPASITDVIHDGNKNDVKANMIVEGGNISMKEEIEEEFQDRGVLIVPDFTANSGGVLSSYAEHKGYSINKMFKLIDKKIGKNTTMVLQHSKESGKSPRKAGLDLAQNIIREKMNKKTTTTQN